MRFAQKIKILALHQNINGMGFINFTVEPHFNIKNDEVLQDLIEYSKDLDIYALEDDAYIIIKNNVIKFMGNIYRIYNGKIKKL